MFFRQPGFLGGLFLRDGRRPGPVSLTLWEDGGAVEALESSPSYRKMTREMVEEALLGGRAVGRGLESSKRRASRGGTLTGIGWLV
jgi:hypothetical protein